MKTLALILVVAACHDSSPRREQPLTALVAQCTSKELGCPRPIFAVKDFRAALAYYRDTLGFKVDWEWADPGQPADFASVTRGDATIFIGQNRDARGDGQLWVFAKKVDKLYTELAKKGAVIRMPPTDMPWGSRELHVLDRDGNLIRFAGPTRDQS